MVTTTDTPHSPSFQSYIPGAPIHHNGSHSPCYLHCQSVPIILGTQSIFFTHDIANHSQSNVDQMTFQLPAPVSLYFSIGTHCASPFFLSVPDPKTASNLITQCC